MSLDIDVLIRRKKNGGKGSRIKPRRFSSRLSTKNDYKILIELAVLGIMGRAEDGIGQDGKSFLSLAIYEHLVQERFRSQTLLPPGR